MVEDRPDNRCGRSEKQSSKDRGQKRGRQWHIPGHDSCRWSGQFDNDEFRPGGLQCSGNFLEGSHHRRELGDQDGRCLHGLFGGGRSANVDVDERGTGPVGRVYSIRECLRSQAEAEVVDHARCEVGAVGEFGICSGATLCVRVAAVDDSTDVARGGTDEHGCLRSIDRGAEQQEDGCSTNCQEHSPRDPSPPLAQHTSVFGQRAGHCSPATPRTASDWKRASAMA